MRLIFFFIFLKAYSIDPFIMGALGDSISTGFNSYHLLSERGGAWSTGDKNFPDFESHKMKIEKLLEKPILAFNMAIPGVKSKSLIRQAKRLLRVAPKPNYVTILVGANDVCSWKKNYVRELVNYRQNVELAIKEIIASSPKAKILLVPLPKIDQLYELGKKNLKCHRAWKLLSLCNPLFANHLTAAERRQFAERVKEINNNLKQISENYVNNAYYYEILEDLDLEEEHISQIDCFHPSAYGQTMISEFTFNRDLFTEYMPKK